MPTDRPGRTRPVLMAVAGIIALVLVGIGWVTWPRGTTEISHQEAVADFRRSSPTGGATDSPGVDHQAAASTGPDDAPERPSTPEPGVYTYRAQGSEQVKLGPFPAEDRPMPDTVSIVVSESSEAHDAGDPGDSPGNTAEQTATNGHCFDWTLNLFAEHTETTTWCVDSAGTLRMAAHTKQQRIGALSPTATLSCDPDVLLAPGETDTALDCELRLDGGPASISARMAGTATKSPTEVDQTTVFEVNYSVSGDLSGTWSETYWLNDDLLPVRIERNLELSGPANLSEHSILELDDLTPTR